MREWLVVKDIVDAQWEFWRIRGFKAGVLNVALPEVIADRMKSATGKALTNTENKHMREQLLRVLNDEPDAREAFAGLLAEYQLTMEGIATSAFKQQVSLQLELDKHADAAQQRRNGAYAEFDALRNRPSLRSDTPSFAGSSPGIRHIEAGSIAPEQPTVPEQPPQPASREDGATRPPSQTDNANSPRGAVHDDQRR
jgi:hypothetical protein